MNKAELASYLVSLHTLIEAQMKSSHSIPSIVLAAEYERCWDQLKETIKDETRTRSDKHDDRNQSGAGVESDLPRESQHDRRSPNLRDDDEANDLRPGT